MTSNKDESPRFELVSFDSFEGVATQTISYQTERLEVLGFEHEADYCLSNPEKHDVRFYTRLCSYPAYNCYAEIYQSVEDARPRTEVRHAFISMVERDWRVWSMGHEQELSRRGIERELFGHPKSFWAGDEVPASHAA